MKYILSFVLGIALTSLFYNEFTYYRYNCDTQKFGPGWISLSQLNERKFACLNTNIELKKESNLKVLVQLYELTLHIYR